MSVRPPLDGVRVLDLSRVLAGPYCTMMLADLGASVVKVERPGSGDQSRAWGPPWLAGESTYYLSVNRGKRCLAADLTDDRAVAAVRRLAERADVVVENFLPGGADRLGLGYAALSAANPRLVYCSIGGYPPESPDAGRPGFDFAIQGAGGIMSITGEADGPPMKVGVAVVDITTGMFATSAVLAALLDVERTGRGRYVSTSLFDASVSWLANRGSEVLNAAVEPARLGNAHPSIVPYETFRARDGYINIAVGTDGQFAILARELGRPDWAADERFATNQARVAHRETLVPAIGELLAARDVADWVARLGAAGVPVDRVRTIPEVARDAPYTVAVHPHATAGTVRSFRSPMAIDGAYLTAHDGPPTLGQHSEEILRELGYDGDELAELMSGPCRSGA